MTNYFFKWSLITEQKLRICAHWISCQTPYLLGEDTFQSRPWMPLSITPTDLLAKVILSDVVVSWKIWWIRGSSAGHILGILSYLTRRITKQRTNLRSRPWKPSSWASITRGCELYFLRYSSCQPQYRAVLHFVFFSRWIEEGRIQSSNPIHGFASKADSARVLVSSPFTTCGAPKMGYHHLETIM